MNDLSNDVLDALRQCVGTDNLLTDESECWNYGYDNSRRHVLPQAVAFATCHEQVLSIVRLCNQHQIPLTARGRGTGTTGAKWAGAVAGAHG